MMKKIAGIVLLVLLSAVTASAVPRSDGPKFKGWSGPKPAKPPCVCRSRQGKVNLGGTICQMRNGRMITLRCELVLNNTAWKEIGEGCQVSGLDPAQGAMSLPDRT